MTYITIEPSNQRWQKLADFRESYPLYSVPIQNTNWAIYDTDGAKTPLLLKGIEH